MRCEWEDRDAPDDKGIYVEAFAVGFMVFAAIIFGAITCWRFLFG